MRILIFGGSGMLGHKLVQQLQSEHEIFATLHGPFDAVSRFGIFDETRTIPMISADDAAAVQSAVEKVRPEVVVNAVGVIKQLPSSKDVIGTVTVNSIFPHRLAELSSEFGFRLITVSTDCVFDGVKGNYTEQDVPNARDLYGISKHLGEVTSGNALTIRTSIIGRELASAHSLVEWFLSNRGGAVRGYVNAIYSGFPTVVFASIISDLILDRPDLNGLFHISSAPVNKYDLLCLIRDKYELDIAVEPFEEFRIDRSLDSSRFRAETGFEPMPWEEMIEAMAADPTPYETWRK